MAIPDVRHAFALLFVGALVFSGATAGAEPLATPPLSRVALALGDLPSGYAQDRSRSSTYDPTKHTPAETAYATRNRLGGYESSFTRGSGLFVSVAASGVSRWRSGPAAQAVYAAALRDMPTTNPGFRPLSLAAKLGDERFMLVRDTNVAKGELTVRHRAYMVIWTRGPTLAFVTTSGVKELTTPALSIKLATAIDRRMSR
jgi:hypothetical protein